MSSEGILTAQTDDLDRVAAGAPSPSEGSERFGFGGIAFEVLSRDPGLWALGDEHRRCIGREVADPLAVARVLCSVVADDSVPLGPREVSWRWEGHQARVTTARADALVSQLGHACYAATARIVSDGNGASSLLTSLAAAIVSRQGGVVMHASGVELDGQAVLFIGPSGAGKTTACNHMAGARAFARDRAALVPALASPTGWAAWVMPGGDEIGLPGSGAVALPLAGILRVRRGTPSVRIARAPAASALVVLRESAQRAGSDADDEESGLGALLSLASSVPVGVVHSVLSAPLTEIVRRWISGSERVG